MTINIKATAVTVGLVWGVLVMFLGGMGNLLFPSYGQALLDVMASIYPGYTAEPTFGQVVIGTIYSLVDGAVVGAVFAWVYNRVAPRFSG